MNIKSKRRRNLIKKIIELKRLCGQEIFLVINDVEVDKLYLYNSQPDYFGKDNLSQILKQSDGSMTTQCTIASKIHTYLDNDYLKFKFDSDTKSVCPDLFEATHDASPPQHHEVGSTWSPELTKDSIEDRGVSTIYKNVDSNKKRDAKNYEKAPENKIMKSIITNTPTNDFKLPKMVHYENHLTPFLPAIDPLSLQASIDISSTTLSNLN